MEVGRRGDEEKKSIHVLKSLHIILINMRKKRKTAARKKNEEQ